MELKQARAIAQALEHRLSPFCRRVQVAGSVRRYKPDVHDIEIVVQPAYQAKLDMFNNAVGWRNLLEEHLAANPLGEALKNGEKYKQFLLSEGINLDLFIVTPPADWGVILAIRTGPADFSKQLVTKKRYGGLLPSDCRVEEGRVMRGGKQVWSEKALAHVWVKGSGEHVPLPEEIDFLQFCGLGWIEPVDRGATGSVV